MPGETRAVHQANAGGGPVHALCIDMSEQGHDDIAAALRDWAQPHWVWGAAFVFVPVCLVLVGFVGATSGSTIPLDLASIAPKIALAIAVAGLAFALLLRRRVPITITMLGAILSAAGFFLLRWLSA